MASSPLRFGIVGCGVIGAVHAEAIASLPDAELIALSDPDPAASQRLAGRFCLPSYPSLPQMLASERVDVIDVCTPSGVHGEQTIAAMLAGKHVIVEKPMEIAVSRIDDMLRVQRETGVKLAVISQHRFDEASQRIRTLLQEGAFGRLVLANAHVLWWRSQQYYDSGAWRGTWALDGGGVLMNQSIHSIDLLIWFMGRVRSVRAYTDTLAHQMETEDVAVAALRFAGGAVGTIAATTAAYPGVTTRIELFGDRGSAMVEDDRLTYLHLARDDTGDVGSYGASGTSMAPHPHSAEQSANRNPAAIAANTHAAQIADMIRAIREDGTPLVDGVAARHPVQVILAMYESARTGREITLE